MILTTDDHIRYICEHPDDDQPRLEFADWLEDRAGTVTCPGCKGDGRSRGALWASNPHCPACAGRGWVSDGLAELAEFVRVQVALALVPSCQVAGKVVNWGTPLRACRDLFFDATDKGFGPHCGSCHDFIRLRRREGELFGAHGAAWFPPRACLTPPNERERRAGLEWLVVRRGFVSEVHCPLAVWVGGGECPTCQGEGRIGQHYDPSSDTYRGGRRCPGCPTVQGETVGIAAEVCRRHPVRTFAATDREPHNYGGVRWMWLSEESRHPMSVAQDENRVPPAVYAELERHAGAYTVGRACYYPTRDAALEALSLAAVAYGREQAGLPG